MTYINSTWDGRRDYEATQVVAVVYESQPGSYYRECSQSEFDALIARGVQQLHIVNGHRYYGWL